MCEIDLIIGCVKKAVYSVAVSEAPELLNFDFLERWSDEVKENPAVSVAVTPTDDIIDEGGKKCAGDYEIKIFVDANFGDEAIQSWPQIMDAVKTAVLPANFNAYLDALGVNYRYEFTGEKDSGVDGSRYVACFASTLFLAAIPERNI